MTSVSYTHLDVYKRQQEGSVFGKRFANSGGVTAAVIESMKEKGEDVDCKVCKANGAAECKNCLLYTSLHV